MAKRFFKNYSNAKVKRFLFFLALASILWVLTRFGREFTSSMSARIEYKNFPATAVLAEENPQEIYFDLTANGFEILFYKLKKPTLSISVEDYRTKNNVLTISKEELYKELEKNFNRYMEIRNLAPDPLKVRLDPIVLKKVKVIARTDIDLRKGFQTVGDFQLDPKEITISGPKGIIENIDTIFTQTVSLKRVDRNISEKVSLESPSSEIVSLEPAEVDFAWKVMEFSEGKYHLPIEVINLPPGIELKLIPERVEVKFHAAVEQFSEISENNFRVICDYSKRNKEENFMTAELVKSPKQAVNATVDPKKIEFFIFK